MDFEKLSYSIIAANLSHHINNLTLPQIHLGITATKLNAYGIHNLYDLINVIGQSATLAMSLEESEYNHVKRTIYAINQSIRSKGKIDWSEFCRIMNFKILPHDRKNLKSGHDFLESFDDVIYQLTNSCFDKFQSDILKSRLNHSLEMSKTHEDISLLYYTPIQNVRDQELVILERLYSALINAEYPDLNFRFSSEFSLYWEFAQLYLKDSKIFKKNDFINILCSAWNVERKDLFNKLPFIYSVLTKDSILPDNIKDFLSNSATDKNDSTSIQRVITLRGFRTIH